MGRPMRMRRMGAALLAAVALGACDLPTSLPRVESRFVLPGEATTLSVAELLPAGLAVAGDRFRLSLPPAGVPRTTLGELCGAVCAALHGSRAPKPAFQARIVTRVPFPAELASATLASGGATVVLRHDFGFDPLRPPGAPSEGSLAVVVRSGGRTLGTATVAGPFPGGADREIALAFSPGEVAGSLEVEVELFSPAGGTDPASWVSVDTAASIRGEVRPLPIDLAEARLAVSDRAVSAAGAELDLTGVDAAISGRVRSGALVVELRNPFAVSGTLTLRLATDAGTLTRPLALAPGDSRQRLEFSGDELRLLLGRRVAVSAAGRVDAAEPVRVQPEQAVEISTSLDLVVELGPEGGG